MVPAQMEWSFRMIRMEKERKIQAAKKQMIDRHLIARGIKDPGVLRAMERVPRERFVPGHLQNAAYGDHALPVDYDQTISQPYIVALMTEALELKGAERVLEVGTGSGYQCAILSELSKEVYTVERIEPLTEKAKKVLEDLGYGNIHFKVSDGTFGWVEHAPYHAIIVTAGAPDIPQPLLDQLAEGGRLVIPVGGRMGQDLIKATKRKGKLVKESLGPVQFVSLVGAHGWKDSP
jgi:protein-L-isoaspartate(D-aspartate) O-methyltransferase